MADVLMDLHASHHVWVVVVAVESQERYWYPDDGGEVWVAGYYPVDAAGRFMSREALEAAGLLVSHVAGALHRPEAVASDDAAPGRPLTLRAEPDNPHDPHAVAVLTAAGERVGYVPRELNTARRRDVARRRPARAARQPARPAQRALDAARPRTARAARCDRRLNSSPRGARPPRRSGGPRSAPPTACARRPSTSGAGATRGGSCTTRTSGCQRLARDRGRAGRDRRRARRARSLRPVPVALDEPAGRAARGRGQGDRSAARGRRLGGGRRRAGPGPPRRLHDRHARRAWRTPSTRSRPASPRSATSASTSPSSRPAATTTPTSRRPPSGRWARWARGRARALLPRRRPGDAVQPLRRLPRLGGARAATRSRT